jgi:hypothetical protein
VNALKSLVEQKSPTWIGIEEPTVLKLKEIELFLNPAELVFAFLAPRHELELALSPFLFGHHMSH